MAKVPVIDIRPCDLATVREILRRHVPNHEVLAFGSRVKWTARQYSDLDLAIRSDEEIPWETISAIKNELSESRLPMMVDVLDMASVSETFRGIIEEEYAVVQRAGQSGWRNTKLGGICHINPDSRGSDWHHETIKYIDISSVGSGIFNESPKKIPVGEAPSRAKRLVAKSDTIVSTVRPNRRSFMFLNSPSSDMVASTGFAVLRARRDVADPRFLYYLVTHQEFTDYLVSRTEGSAYPAVNPSVFGDADVCVPPLSEQRKIARILGALDDKIELNRRMNRTLEAMAQAIFKSWFVNFDPVHAKAKRRNTGLPPEIADLFPAQFQDSELGKIPRGWEVKPLDEIAEFLNGLALQKRRPQAGEDDLPVIKIAELRSGVTARSERASAGIPEKYVIKDGDVIFSWSGSLLQTIWTGGTGALNQHLFKVSSSQYPKWFCYFWVDRHLPDFQRIAAGKATTMGHIQRHHLTEAKTVVPDARLLKAADKHLSTIFAKIVATARAGRFAIKLRDTLLPDMISGRIRPETTGESVKITT